ncbi:MAG: DUF535 family protein, partial [Acidaminococcaceae bacterium]
IKDMLAFFAKNPLRQKILAENPAFVEQVTRAFFYKEATWEERIELVKSHVSYLEKTCTPELLEKLYCKHEMVDLWVDEFQGKPLFMSLLFHAGQRKEGCLSLVLRLGKENLYQIMFWLAPELKGRGTSLWIGALQGTSQGKELIKAMTKQFFGYRTKNLIFYGVRNLAAVLGCKNIYAVTNQGYYAMNHLRVDRKLKTSFGDFWQECGGSACEDIRFYEIPLVEQRKDMAESKRANHRRRYELMDKITASLKENLVPYLRVSRNNK